MVSLGAMNWQHRATGIAYSLKKAGRTGQPAGKEADPVGKAGADAVSPAVDLGN
jgi:hypothetical protein